MFSTKTVGSSNPNQLMPLFQPFQTCFLVWEKDRELYTNGISCFYNVISGLANLKNQDSDMSTYLGTGSGSYGRI